MSCILIMDMYQTATTSLVNPEDSVKVPVAWMQNHLDGRHHPALNTENPNVVYQSDKQAFVLLEDKPSLDL